MPALQVEVSPLGGDGMAPYESTWRELEQTAGDRSSLYLSFDWLSAWVEVYRPGALSLVRVAREKHTVALGLLDLGRRGRWRFAGYPVTSQRGLLCSDDESTAWSAFADWLRQNRKHWTSLAAEGVRREAGALPGAVVGPDSVFVISVPSSFDEYLAARPGSARRRLTQRLRYFEQAGGRVVQAEGIREATRELVHLHNARAATKGEVHAQMNDALAELLETLAARKSCRVILTQAVVGGETVGVAAHLDYGGTTYFYNAGIRGEGARISPGLVLELDAIRSASARGSRVFDLGPGAYRYKTELGGVPEERVTVHAAAPTLRGRTEALRAAARGRVRSFGPARRLHRLVRR